MKNTTALLLLSFSLLVSCAVQEPVPARIKTSSIESDPTTPYIINKSIYTGTVGNSRVRAELAFHSDDTVTGFYTSYESGNRYKLEGTNPAQGRLLLTEYSPGDWEGYRATSTTELRKKITSDTITWEGTMRNYDGRNVSVKLKKTQ